MSIYDKNRQWTRFQIDAEFEYIGDSKRIVQARNDLQAETTRLRGLLKRVEWIELRYCTFCSHFRSEGHADDCELAEAIKEVTA